MSVEELTFTYTDENDWSYDVSIVLDMYNDSHNLFVAFVDCEDMYSDRMFPLTKGSDSLPYLQSVIDVYDNEKQTLDFLLNNNLGAFTGEIVMPDSYLYFMHPIFQFKEDVLKEINPLFMEEYRKQQPENRGYQSIGVIEAIYNYDYVVGVLSRVNGVDIDRYGIFNKYDNYFNYLDNPTKEGSYIIKASMSDEEFGYLKKLTDLAVGRNLDAYTNDESWFVRYEVARNKHKLDDLVRDPDKRVRVKVAEEGDERHLKILADDPEWIVRQTVAHRGYELDKLINDPHPIVRKEAEKQQKEQLLGKGKKKNKKNSSKASESKKSSLTEQISDAEKTKDDGIKNLYVVDQFKDFPGR